MSNQVRLTLIFPPALESAVVETLASNPRTPGFTIVHAEGHGQDFANASAIEIVRGRIAQRVLWIATNDEACAELLRDLKEKVPSPQIVWWIDPLISFGRLL